MLFDWRFVEVFSYFDIFKYLDWNLSIIGQQLNMDWKQKLGFQISIVLRFIDVKRFYFIIYFIY